ncbi:MAG: peptidase U32 family protein [Enterococcus sp.]
MIELISTVESFTQAKELLEVGVDTLYFGEETFGLRLPSDFSREEQKELVTLAHQKGKKVTIAMNAIMHPEKMLLVPEYLAFLKEIQVDQIVVGDPGIVYVMRKNPELKIPFIFDAATIVTSARQINFWQKKGAIGAVLAREVPFGEMQELTKAVDVPVEVLVYGPTCIHHSKRPLLQNYYNYTQQEESVTKERGLFLSEPKKEETHYSIYEDSHGTHVFADNDLDLMLELAELNVANYKTWKLDGLFCSANFVKIAALFATAKEAILAGVFTQKEAQELDAKVKQLHPEKRGLDTGFYYIDPTEIK